MSVILLNDSTMIDIADAIREKSGSTDQMLPSEMGGAIRGIETGIKIPETIVAGETPVLAAMLYQFSDSSEYKEIIGITIKKGGTYKFTIFTSGTGGEAYLKNNDSNIKKLNKNGRYFVIVNCQAGDRVSIIAKNDSNNYRISIDSLIVSIQWENAFIFTSCLSVSQAQHSTIYSTSMKKSSISVIIPKTAMYKLTSQVNGSGEIQLYKNGSAIGETYKVDSSTRIYTTNIFCNINDELILYGKTNANSLTIYQLIAEEIVDV